MKNFYFLAVILVVSLLVSSCNQQTKKSQESDNKKVEEPVKKSLWTDDAKIAFINSHSKSDFDKFVIAELIAQYEYEKTSVEIEGALNNQSFQDFKKYQIKKFVVDIDKIAGKTPSEVKAVLGETEKKEKSNPSGTPCPCDKCYYLNELVEIIYMNGKADWITVNNSSSFYKSNKESSYLSFQRFSDYGYIKVSVK
jgi:hypothetical protein